MKSKLPIIILIVLFIIISILIFFTIKIVFPTVIGAKMLDEARESIENSDLRTGVAEAFNEKFIFYKGTDKKGTEARNLIKQIMNTNMESEKIKLELDSVDYTNNEQTAYNKILQQKKYTIDFEYDAEGFINKAIITKNQ